MTDAPTSGVPSQEPATDSPEPVPVPPELAAQTLSFWDAQLRTVLGLAQQAADPYVSKERLRQIAKLALMQLAAMTEAAKQAEELDAAEVAQQLAQAPQAKSNLILPSTNLVIP